MKSKITGILEFLNQVELLKSVTRHSWSSKNRHESVAEHSWRMAVFAMVLTDEFPNLDMRKVLEMCLIHDFGEAYEGDHPAFHKQPADKVSIEERAVRKIIETLPNKMQKRLLNTWKEYEDYQTEEAKLVKALDKLEVIIQHNEADISTWDPKEYSYNLIHGLKYMDFNEFIRNFRSVVDEQTREKIKAARVTHKIKPETKAGGAK
jgi:putative hydrolase of HD superfamily